MAELLLELFSEEIPARMQKRAEEDLARAFGEKLKAAGLEPKGLATFSTPRRLGLTADLPAKAADVNEEKKGPRVGAPDQAIQGFLKSAGLSSIDQAQVVEDKKGAFYVARIERAGRETSAILQDVIPEIIRAFPWPKSMRSQSSDLQWVRPLHNILCLFDGAPVKISIDTIASKPITQGHRFHAPGEIKVTGASHYKQALAGAHVVLEREERKRIILEGAKAACAARGLELVEDAGLLEEVAGLAEWPVVLLGDMDPAFLDLPAEVIRLSMRTHQKYFAVRGKDGKLAPHFVTVANVDAKDGGKAIAAGNARVLSARLNDARFFWDTDKKQPLGDASRVEKLKKIVFHQKLGSVWDKVERVKALAAELCAVTGADAKLVARAAELSKCDLVTETVGEFPELQGQIGRQLYLAQLEPPPREGRGQGAGRASAPEASNAGGSPHPPTPSPRGEAESIALAIEDHYRPLGPNDRVPSDKVAVTLALADKLDTLVGFWAIDEKPTGSSDPFALRRAALGFVRTILENYVRLSVRDVVTRGKISLEQRYRGFDYENLFLFLADRLKVQLRDQGKRHDLVDAVFALGDDDLVRIVARVEALNEFLKAEDGKNLLAGYKRAANIYRAEVNKGRPLSESDHEVGLRTALLLEPAEKTLASALDAALPAARAAVEKEDFAAAMKALSGLRAPVDAFFEGVLVNAEDASLRRNRLLLLSRLVEALSAVADFSKIEG